MRYVLILLAMFSLNDAASTFPAQAKLLGIRNLPVDF